MTDEYRSVVSQEEKEKELRQVLQKLRTDITILGLGGGGSNTVSRLWEEGIADVSLIAANTDAQHLLKAKVPNKILLGRRTTQGLGAGDLPQIGKKSAQETKTEIMDALEGSDMVFLTLGLGGGTGTGSVPLVAQLSKDLGALTIVVCTFPFIAEGNVRKENAEWGLERVRNVADTVIVIPNDKLLELVPRLSLNEAFRVADEVLMRAIKGITELITKPGLINLDFNDLNTIMKGAGVAMIGLGEGEGEDRIEVAIEEAIDSPLLDVDISTAEGVLVNVVGGEDMTVAEGERAANLLHSQVSPDAEIIWGAVVDPEMENRVRVMVVIIGVRSSQILGGEKEPTGIGEIGVEEVR